MKRRLIVIIVMAVSVVVLVCIFSTSFIGDMYNSVGNWLSTTSDYGRFYEGPVTNKELLLTGYLGIFFRFNIFGWLNWLAIPLFVYFLITIKKRERWEIALYLALCIACIFIIFKGYYAYRYQLTIFPILITTIFLFGWQVLRKKNRKVVFGIILICSGLLLGNCYFLRDTYVYYWNKNIGSGIPGERFPYKLIEYINNYVDDDSEIVGRNQPILYYYASEKKKLRGPGKSKYLLIRLGSDSVAGYDLEYEDQGYKLYKKKEDKTDQFYNNYLYEQVYSKKSLVKNGSFENWQANQNLLPDFWYIYGTGSAQKENSDKKFGKYALKITGDNFNFYQNVTLSGLASEKEKKISCFAWLKTAVPDKYRIQIYDGIDSSFSERHKGDGYWQLLRAIHTINPKAKSVELRVVQAERTNGLNDVVYVDGILLFPGEYYSPNALLMEQGRH